MSKSKWARRTGAVALQADAIQWRVWAPNAQRAELALDGHGRGALAMSGDGDGYFTHTEPNVAEGQRYTYRLNGGEARPDPCSLWQPDGVGGPSAIVRPERIAWSDAAWKGLPRQDLVIYELHVGTFTPEGTFDAIIPRLAELKALGITALEIMPVNQFPGGRNWGYDGVLPYATQNTYGGPHGLARLVDAAHAHGVAVVLDVVYNHFGPEGAYFREFGPYFTDKYKTPWGAAINYDGPGSDGVRDFVLDNVRMWLEEFHLDGLRLDAVHAIYDLGARHILASIKETAEAVAREQGREIVIIGESDLNDPRIIRPRERGGHGLDAQWSDDFHHAVHACLTGERRGYYSEYGAPEQVARALETPFLFAWTYSPHRQRKHGAPPDPDLTAERFVVCIQNHDQVGNRAAGDRLPTLLDHPGKQRLASSLLLLAPYVPLIFMGEEYGEVRPFPFFCSFSGAELIEAVRTGRKSEFKDLVGGGEDVPDPAAVETFESAKLSWSWPQGTHHAALRRLYQDLITARRTWPAMRDFAHRSSRLLDGNVIELTRGQGDSLLRAFINLSGQNQPPPQAFSPHAVVLFTSEAPQYGGMRQETNLEHLLPYECLVIAPPGVAKG
ncbi:MAG TPA: malto-oligosyltrehalose trehalohydrolase [Tepidisphaeraceae bacterium]|nr:malto-oligosyltrehalose trehalohydrolase [Tepidisphaeraceae bacterium]